MSSFFLGKEPGVFDVVIINDDLERAYEELKDILSEVRKKTNCSGSITPVKHFHIHKSKPTVYQQKC